MKIGDEIIVKNGVITLESGVDMSGWTGNVSNKENDGTICINFDRGTVNNMPKNHKAHCKKSGIHLWFYTLYEYEVDLI